MGGLYIGIRNFIMGRGEKVSDFINWSCAAYKENSKSSGSEKG